MFWIKNFAPLRIAPAGVCLFILSFAAVATVEAETRLVIGGQTSVLLDPSAFSTFGLEVVGFNSNVISPGELGPDSVAFAIEPQSGFDFNPTTFFYDSPDFAPFGGVIAHSGVVFFDQPFLVGNFEVGFDEDRVTATTSGFFVVSTADVFVPVFDLGIPSLLDAQPDSLSVRADLLISPEFADFWFDSPLAGLDVGDALISATATAIPEPNSFSALAVLGVTLLWRRRR